MRPASLAIVLACASSAACTKAEEARPPVETPARAIRVPVLEEARPTRSFAIERTPPSGTSRRGRVVASPALLVATFGPPMLGDGDKVSGEYAFRSGDDVVTVYEWESTSLALEGCGPAPAKFWATDEPYEFEVGARHDAPVADFVQWFHFELAAAAHRRTEGSVRTTQLALESWRTGRIRRDALRRQFRTMIDGEELAVRLEAQPEPILFGYDDFARRRFLRRWFEAQDSCRFRRQNQVPAPFAEHDPRGLHWTIAHNLSAPTGGRFSVVDVPDLLRLLDTPPGAVPTAWNALRP